MTNLSLTDLKDKAAALHNFFDGEIKRCEAWTKVGCDTVTEPDILVVAREFDEMMHVRLIQESSDSDLITFCSSVRGWLLFAEREYSRRFSAGGFSQEAV